MIVNALILFFSSLIATLKGLFWLACGTVWVVLAIVLDCLWIFWIIVCSMLSYIIYLSIWLAIIGFLLELWVTKVNEPERCRYSVFALKCFRMFRHPYQTQPSPSTVLETTRIISFIRQFPLSPLSSPRSLGQALLQQGPANPRKQTLNALCV